MSILTIADGTETFEATVLPAATGSRAVLFAAGGGGDPGRHLPLLSTLAASGCTVVAPHFERLASPRPTESELLLRTRRLTLALDAVLPSSASLAGLGHSIGGAALLALAGALDAVRTPILAWAGSEDTITPPDQVDVLKHAGKANLPVDVRLAEGAGHFSFMDQPPPQSIEPLPDRPAFLDMLSMAIGSLQRSSPAACLTST